MPRKEVLPTEVKPQSMEDKMDIIIAHLQKMDRRDRTRMIASYFRTMIWLGSVLFFVWSTWYLIAKGPELMTEMTKMMMQQSIGIGGSSSDQESGGGFMQMLEEYMQ